MGLGPNFSSGRGQTPQQPMIGRVVFEGRDPDVPRLKAQVAELERQLNGVRILPNPNKHRFTIEETYANSKNGWVMVVIRYHDCTNYEGRKVMVYDNFAEFEKMRIKGAIDPHFDELSVSPVARFEPTDRGLRLARKMVDLGPKFLKARA